MKPKHTAGPWKHQPGNTYFQKRGKLVTTEIVEGAAGEWVAAVIRDYDDGITCSTADRNAKLIAAAPDLLAACKAIRDGWGKNLTEPMAIINAAIDKAEGR